MKFCTTWLVWLFCGLFFSSIAVAETPTFASGEFAQALRLGDQQRMLELAPAVTPQDPHYVDAKLVLAFHDINNQRVKKALEHINQALNVSQTPQVTHAAGLVYGLAAMQSGFFNRLSHGRKAGKLLKQAWQEEPENPKYLEGWLTFNMTAPSILGADKSQIKPLLEQLHSRDAPRALKLWVPYLVSTKGKVEALAWIDQEIKKKQNSRFAPLQELWVARGLLNMNGKDWSAAYQDFTQVIKKAQQGNPAPSDVGEAYLISLYQMGKLSSITGRWSAEGIRSLGAYLAADVPPHLPPKAWAAYRLGLIHRKQGKTAQACQRFQQARELGPDKDLIPLLRKAQEKCEGTRVKDKNNAS